MCVQLAGELHKCSESKPMDMILLPTVSLVLNSSMKSISGKMRVIPTRNNGGKRQGRTYWDMMLTAALAPAILCFSN